MAQKLNNPLWHTLLNLQHGGGDSNLLKYCTNCIKLLGEDICFAKAAKWPLAICKVQWPEVWLMPEKRLLFASKESWTMGNSIERC